MMRVCHGIRRTGDVFHVDICFDVRDCPMCEALKKIDEQSVELMELRKQIIELEKKREVLGA